jgi:hypothetical protein
LRRTTGSHTTAPIAWTATTISTTINVVAPIASAGTLIPRNVGSEGAASDGPGTTGPTAADADGVVGPEPPGPEAAGDTTRSLRDVSLGVGEPRSDEGIGVMNGGVGTVNVGGNCGVGSSDGTDGRLVGRGRIEATADCSGSITDSTGPRIGEATEPSGPGSDGSGRRAATRPGVAAANP